MAARGQSAGWFDEWLTVVSPLKTTPLGLFSFHQSMNTASQDLPHHLSILRERAQHPTDYEKAFYYFLEEFAGDAKFILGCDPDEAPGLVAVVAQIASKALGKTAEVEGARVLRCAEHGFIHGHALIAGRLALFFYFQKLDTGIMAIIPGVRGGTEMARFRMPGGLPDPRAN